MLPNETHSVLEIARLDSAITGIMAGFALTIVVLLVERLANKSSDVHYDATLGKATILVFVAAFFTSTLASFLFGVSAAEKENSARAFMLLMLPAFAFVLSVVLFSLGLVLLLAAYKLKYALEPARVILYMVLCLALFNYIYTASDVIAVMYKVPSIALLSQPPVVLSLLTPSAICLFLGYIIRRRRYKPSRVQFDQRWFRGLILVDIIASAVVGVLLTSILISAPPYLFVPFQLILVLVVGLSVLIGWSILYIPTSDVGYAEISSTQGTCSESENGRT